MIEVKDLWKSFGANQVLKGITLTIPEGTTYVVLGGSGSGKTVLMKHVIGLLKALIFGAIVSVITTWRGYAATGGAKGVGEGTTRGVVWSSISILVADYIITFLAVGTG